jgi:hypothetical protein
LRADYLPKEDKKDYIAFNIYPGNTKQQGYQIFNKSLDWQNKTSLMINGVGYDIEIWHHVKLCHFNRYVSHIDFHNRDVLKPLHTLDNFNKSGKWKIDTWNDFEKLMDDNATKKWTQS